MDSVTVTEGEVYTLPECGFDAPEGYKFAIWSYGDLIKFDTPGTNVTITGNTTFKANWKKKYIVPIDDNVNGTVTPLNITNISNSVFNSNITDITIRIDENISYFTGALIITNFTVQTENTTSVGSTVFSANVFNNTESAKLKDYMGLNPDTSKNETFNIFLNHSSSSVVGAFIYNNESNNNESDFYNKWRKRELPSDYFGFNSTNMNITLLNNTQARAYSGSTVVELTGEYLRTLEPGIYAIYFEFENGRAATLFAVENSTSVTPLPEEENGTGSGSGNETENNTGSGSGNETGTESGTGNETETGNNTDSGNTGNESGENNAADTGSAGVIIYLMVAALLAGCVMSLSKGKKRRR
jgi:hypothetical protein